MGRLATVRSVAALRRAVEAWRRRGLSVALVPTMGALHAGHLALVTQGLKRADRVVVSLFVNPTQFGPNEDFSRYPRDEASDRTKLSSAGAHLLYAPSISEMYPDGFATSVSVPALADRLEGEFRPGHFTGVATIVTKLLNQAQADIACFGEKDYQQLQIIARLARDLDIPTRIAPVKTVRERDGLALSSRNAYLSPEERRIASQLYRVLNAVAGRIQAGKADIAGVCAWGVTALSDTGFTAVDYLAICDAATLEPLQLLDRPARVLAAAWLGRTRLIDNIPLRPPSMRRR